MLQFNSKSWLKGYYCNLVLVSFGGIRKLLPRAFTILALVKDFPSFFSGGALSLKSTTTLLI